MFLSTDISLSLVKKDLETELIDNNLLITKKSPIIYYSFNKKRFRFIVKLTIIH